MKHSPCTMVSFLNWTSGLPLCLMVWSLLLQQRHIPLTVMMKVNGLTLAAWLMSITVLHRHGSNTEVGHALNRPCVRYPHKQVECFLYSDPNVPFPAMTGQFYHCYDDKQYCKVFHRMEIDGTDFAHCTVIARMAWSVQENWLGVIPSCPLLHLTQINTRPTHFSTQGGVEQAAVTRLRVSRVLCINVITWVICLTACVCHVFCASM